MEEKGLRVNAGKTKIMICGMGQDLLHSSGEFPCAVCRTAVGSNNIFCKDYKHWMHKECIGPKRLTKDPDYRCTRCRELHAWRQPTEESPSWTWQAGGGSFLLLPRRNALSSRWLWTFNHNTCENRLEEVQGAASSSLFPPLLFQNTWPHVQLVCRASCQWDLAIDNQTSYVCSGITGQWSDSSAISSRRMLSASGSISYLRSLAFRMWTWSWRREAPLVWTRGALQRCSQDSLRHTFWLKAWAWEAQDGMEAADGGIPESGSSQLSTLIIDKPGDPVWDLLCV